MNREKTVLGIDIGSISASYALINPEKKILKTGYTAHHGDMVTALLALLEGIDFSSLCGIACTSSTPNILLSSTNIDSRISYISAVRHLHEKVGSLLIVGAEKFGLVLFDTEGNYQNYRSNTSCAAGTGSFLDQQARRLNLAGIEEFAAIAFDNKGNIPKIASRCAVFAKTDLIHAQQEGFTLSEICDGLCHGLAKNVVDTLFGSITINAPLFFAGGVSKNGAVARHISALGGVPAIIDEYSPVYGAIGAALERIDAMTEFNTLGLTSPHGLLAESVKKKAYYYKPLTLALSDYPVFDSYDSYEFQSILYPQTTPIEADLYSITEPGNTYDVYLGIDIGSTSTKAIVLDQTKNVLAGFYTRTSGQPIIAVQTILEAMNDMCEKKRINFTVLGCGTTGSGRKFVGAIVGADIALDEITAHARAACELDPDVDTIIEIGGQDSKFTTLSNGSVTFSIMNNVCAAGTGSFIEEQARKLGCPLSEYSRRAENAAAPLASDRCTVFMERDINYYLNDGYVVNEVLASVLHSVRENYLTKVAVEKNIGKKIFFQGATARNRALVAAFEQRLGKPIMVSKFCHLTGALGVALHLNDEGKRQSSFRGIGLYRGDIPVKSETCTLCTNHCKLRLADVGGETVAYGFLCGRDYQTQKFISASSIPELLAYRKKIMPKPAVYKTHYPLTIGLPAALHLFDELHLWKKFFELLGIATITSEDYHDGIKDGKNLTGAEFCAPMTALHGHVQYLAEKSDYVFLPEYMENRQKNHTIKRNYCYYTHYAPPLITVTPGVAHRDKILTPVIRSIYTGVYVRKQLYDMLKNIGCRDLTFRAVCNAFDRAHDHWNAVNCDLRYAMRKDAAGVDDVQVVFLGRPYSVLSRSMNNGIPKIFSKMGIRTYFQDMLDYTRDDVKEIEELLQIVHWKYAAQILESAHVVSQKRGLYPVFITSFKCTPDAYVIEFFKRILDRRGKPYLILQLDEHDSSVGYETRIEAAVRSFKNHLTATEKYTEQRPEKYHAGISVFQKDVLNGKTFLFPNWDDICCRLIVAMLRREGYDAHVVAETTDSIQRSMRFNTAQCVPLNTIAQNYIDYIERHNLDPKKTVVWSPESKVSCNLGMFPLYTKKIFETYGKGMEQVSVYAGNVTFTDISARGAINAYCAFMFGGMLRKMGCHTRPYEQKPGMTDSVIAEARELLYLAFVNDTPKTDVLEKVIGMFESIPVKREERPKVAIFGDLYVRDNNVMNQNLIKIIEANGGEVVTTPYNELVRVIVDLYIRKWFKQGNYFEAAFSLLLKQVIPILDKRYGHFFDRILGESSFKVHGSPEDIMAKFNIKLHHTGESMENIMKIFHLIDQYPDLSLFVQTNPSYCCPSLISEAMGGRIEEVTGIPVVSIEYDGTGASKNEDVIPYLRYARKRGMKQMLMKK